jgi:hypothetical protein
MVERDEERAQVEEVWGAGIPVEPGRDGRAILEAVVTGSAVFADKNYAGLSRPLAEDRLGGILVEIASLTMLSGLAQRLHSTFRRKKFPRRCRCPVLRFCHATNVPFAPRVANPIIHLEPLNRAGGSELIG